jgi:hypothetical protein
MTEPVLGVSADGLTWTGHVYEPIFGSYVGVVTIRCHDPRNCAGQSGCAIHRPSEHHMRDWRLSFRADKYCMERQCEHGKGHPDPDDLAYHISRGQGDVGIHGCDGCCRAQ